jgi:hypothetical protein
MAAPLASAPPLPSLAVVVVLTKHFISKKYPMEELHLLLERDRQGTRATLLPFFYGISTEDLGAKVEEYLKAPTDDEEQQLKLQWAKDLTALGGITGPRPDQVLACVLSLCA